MDDVAENSASFDNLPDPSLPEAEQAPQPVALLGRRAVIALTAGALALYFFIRMAEAAMHGTIVNFDSAVRGWVHRFASPPLTKAMLAISFAGSGLLLALFVISVVVFLAVRWRRAALWLVTTMAGCTVLTLSLKHGFHRPRPVPWFAATPVTASFPSGHSLFAFSFYGVLAGLLAARVRSPLLKVVIWSLAAVLIASIGLSRIYLGVHYPSDVLAGYLAALFWVGVMITLDQVRLRRKQRRATKANGTATP